MFNDFMLKASIKRYIKQLNNHMLKQYYLNTSRKNPKTHTDNLICKCCLIELKERKLI